MRLLVLANHLFIPMRRLASLSRLAQQVEKYSVVPEDKYSSF